jgi:NAD(P)-dependent dehydrogenase (short-subunit alcohol dehydrogenase family)
MSAEGASVVLADLNLAAADRVANELHNAIAFEVDVSDETSVAQMIEAAVTTFGGLDLCCSLHPTMAAT